MKKNNFKKKNEYDEDLDYVDFDEDFDENRRKNDIRKRKAIKNFKKEWQKHLDDFEEIDEFYN